ncbi:hypothetical protein QR77_38650 [Streptomyces sp. 150FB]|uniref:DsbA family oxidoreductase n=1 Tax=Streptomyces sp. 150FB TaxID=1576605 RepID=UPI00058904BD|nr:DsbA family protein [Streptomyces sp. 150FB]KIF78128.1 hypothetical protein QR77_38650 [Streptomyces sp. 150FB]
MTLAPQDATGTTTRAVTIDHWFDFICPYCYVAQDRNRVLREQGMSVVEHPLQIHPDIGPGGAPAGPRSGPAYDFLAHEAEAAGLPLHWGERIPYSRPALSAFAWLREADPMAGERFAPAVFAAYFADGLDIESHHLLATLAEEAGADGEGLRAALESNAANEALDRALPLADAYGVVSTPTWISGEQRVSGLRPREWFEDWATEVAQ